MDVPLTSNFWGDRPPVLLGIRPCIFHRLSATLLTAELPKLHYYFASRVTTVTMRRLITFTGLSLTCQIYWGGKPKYLGRGVKR